MPRERRVAIAIEIDQPYPQHQELFAGIQCYAREHTSWRCLIDEHPMYQPGRRGPSYGSYDGVIARATPKMQQRLNRVGVPFVNTLFQSARDGVPGVYPDASKLGRAAADHLLERGFRTLCYMGEIDLHRHTAKVGRSFEVHAEKSDASCTLLRMPNPSDLDASAWLHMERALNRWIDQLKPPVALFAEEAPIARMVIQRCQEAGLDIPRDLAVLSQHNLKSVVDVAPQISSIEIDNERAGYEAARLLDRLMSGQPAPSGPLLIPPKGVVGRESTDYFAIQDKLVAQALRHIAAHLGDPLRVEDISYELAVSTRTLQSRFADALGVGVSQEIRRLRLQRAKRLLADPSLTIAQVAGACGFARAQLFSTVFRREIGMTPSEYREQWEEGQS
jgi:LacI family transcriptional regulator